jgi:glycerol uptake facilitator-like aquaporin
MPKLLCCCPGVTVVVLLAACSLLTAAHCCSCCRPVAVFAFGGASGAHLNPAVSLMLLLRGKVSSGKAVAYMVAQVG